MCVLGTRVHLCLHAFPGSHRFPSGPAHPTGRSEGWGCGPLARSRGARARAGAAPVAAGRCAAVRAAYPRAVGRVVVGGLLETFSEVSATSDVSFQERGIVRDGYLLWTGGDCQSCFQRTTSVLTVATVCAFYRDLPTIPVFTQIGVPPRPPPMHLFQTPKQKPL